MGPAILWIGMNQYVFLGTGRSPMSPAQLQEGIASLSRGAYFREASLDMTLGLLTESAARLSGIERVSIWALTDCLRELRCLERFAPSSACRSHDEVLRIDEHPAYFAALARETCIAADDACCHPTTVSLAGSYLLPNGISALLATPIHIRGELQGVLCFEQIGPSHPWSVDYRLFAQAVANLVTLALVEHEAEEARRLASKADERLQVLFECTPEAMLLIDTGSDRVIDANRRAESLFGYRRQELTGRSPQQLYRFVEPSCADGSPATASLGAEMLAADGVARCVEVRREQADAGGGRLAVDILRPATV